MTVGLSGIPQGMLEQLLAAIERGRLECPFSDADLIDAGFKGNTADVVAALSGVDRAGASVALRIAIAERINRPPPRLDLVWTGPETWATVARSTSAVVERLFESAQRSVIVGGYTFDTPEIVEPLHRAMKDRGVTAMLFLNVPSDAATIAEADAVATRFIDQFFHDVWTFGVPKPDVFYDPRTVVRGPPWVSLHAKCVVVDDERSFITSANFTDRGQTRNVEAGVLVEDRAFSGELGAQWRQLVSEKLMTRYRG
jgi:phosphatidylserine/phosphatidylglycerophosphate/cardiolipin synthase-like enzyme